MGRHDELAAGERDHGTGAPSGPPAPNTTSKIARRPPGFSTRWTSP